MKPPTEFSPCSPALLVSVLLAVAAPAARAQGLFVDFNSTTQDGGPHNQEGYQPYNAGHEVSADFISREYAAFGTTLTFTPDWPDTTVNTVEQMIDRGAGNDAQWLGAKIDLLTDWIGVDTRTASGGRGDIFLPEDYPAEYDSFGTRMTFTLAGLPAADYRWRSYHHDTENVHTPFLVEISTDGGANFALVPGPGEFSAWEMTNTSPNSNPPSTNMETGAGGQDPAELPSTVTFQFTATGADVVLRFSPISRTNVHEQLVAVNGFELVESSDTDGDGLFDQWEIENFGNLAQDAAGDPDADGSPNSQEFARSTDPNNSDTDGDGLLDGVESGTGVWVSTADTGTNPLNPDTDGDGLGDAVENPTEPFVDASQPGTDPNLADTDGDLHTDDFEVALGISPKDAAAFPRNDGLWVDFSTVPGNHEPFYQGFIANHETNAADDPVRGVDRAQEFPAFETTVTLAVSYPDIDPVHPSQDAQNVKQLISRGDGNNANYVGENLNLVRDWIGIDARLASFGNGDLEPTSMVFAITGLPAGAYLYRAYHHDTENQHGPFSILVTDADRNDVPFGPFAMTASTFNGINPGAGNGPSVLSSTVSFIIRSNGTDPVEITYQVVEDIALGTRSFVGVNGFELTEAGDSDSDGLPDDYEIEHFGSITAQTGADDFDSDGLDNATEFSLNTDPTNPDTDGDGLNDGAEIAAGTDPFDPDSDGDGLSDGEEVNVAMTNPLERDSDLDGFSDAREVAGGSDPNNPASVPVPDPAEALFVDFNSLTQDGGPNEQAGYRSYEAGHEVIDDFIPADYAVFGTTVTFTPSWPDTPNQAATQQMIDRAPVNDANWLGDQVQLLTDWIGVDTRTGNGGLGNYDGVTGAPTRMGFTLSGLPPATYRWRSYHHDTENVHADFKLDVSTDGGANFTAVNGPGAGGVFSMTSSTGGGAPAAPMIYNGPTNPGSIDPADLPSTVEFEFTATGSDIVLQWTPYANTDVHRQLLAVNGFELAPVGTIAARLFLITSVTYNEETRQVTITWDPQAGKEYNVLFSPDLRNAPGENRWFELADGLTVGTFTDTLPDPAPLARYYIVEEVDE